MRIKWLIRRRVGRIEAGQPYRGVKVAHITRYGEFFSVAFDGARPPLAVHITEIQDFGAE